MTQTVTVPGVGDLDFPDDMSQQDMANAIKHNFPQIHQQKQENPKEVPGDLKSFDLRTPAERVSGGQAVDYLASHGMAKVAPAVGAGIDVLKEVPALTVGGGAGGAAGGALGSLIGGKSARLLMQSALKPLKEARESGKAAKAIDTLLEEGISVSEGGVQKLRGLIDDLNTEIKQKISSSTLSVSKKKVADTLDQLTQKLKNQVNPQGDLKAIRQAWNEFMHHPSFGSRATIPVQEAQKLKQGTYKTLGEKSYGEEKTASIEAQKQLARGLKEQIEKAHPEIGPLNAEEAKLLNALDLTEQRVLAEMNKNPGGLTWLVHNPKAAVAFMADKSGPFKSLMARLLNRAGQPTGKALGAAAGIGAVEGQKALSAPPDR
jgi:hypothetical protein